jgi:hydroxyacylglutathione hydrolase
MHPTLKVPRSIEIDKNIFYISPPKPFIFPSCNGFLFAGPVTALIDAGIGEDTIREIDRAKKIDILIISHTHPDHIISWHVLKDRHIVIPRETPDSFGDLQLLGKRFCDNDEFGIYWARWFAEKYGLRPLRAPDGRIKDLDVVNIGDHKIKAIYAPGHSIDHYCFLELNTGFLITTDIDFSSFGPMYATEESDIEQFEKSVCRVMSLKYHKVCSSHRQPIESNAYSKFKIFLDAFGRQREKILALCERPRTLEEILNLSPFLNKKYHDEVIFRRAELFMINKILEYLILDKLIRLENGRYVRFI